MMFASKTPRDLPWQAHQEVIITPVIVNGEPASIVERDYRPHNEPNPILVDFREHKDDGPVRYVVHSDNIPFGRRPSRLEHYLIQIAGAEKDPMLTEIGLGVEATPAQITHARTVLTRLQNVDWAAWRAPRTRFTEPGPAERARVKALLSERREDGA